MVDLLAQCLFVLSDDNDVVIDTLRLDSSAIACLMDVARQPTPLSNGTTPPNPFANEQSTTVQILASGVQHRLYGIAVVDHFQGVLRNLLPLPPLLPAAAVDVDQEIILPLIQPLLSISLADASAKVVSLLSQKAGQSNISAWRLHSAGGGGTSDRETLVKARSKI